MRSLVAALALTALVSPAHADQDLAEARRLQAALDYEGALAVVDQAIARGDADPDRLAELHLLGGTLAAGLDRTDVAIDHFSRLLALRPGQRLPDGTSPKIAAPFDAARAKNIPALHVTPTYVHGVVTIVPDADPLHLVRGLSVRVVTPIGGVDDVAAQTALRVELPHGSRATEVSALDEHGNRVWVGRLAAEAPPPVVQVNWYGNWKLYGIVGVGVLGFALIAADKMSSYQDEWNALREDDGQHNFSSLTRIQQLGERWATVANISFAVTGALGIATAVEAYRHRPRATDDRVGLRLTPGPGSVGIGLATGF